MILGSIWNDLGTRFGGHFGTRLAQEEPRLAQEDHQELERTENHVFFKVFGFQGRPRQLLKTQEGSQEVILDYLGPS